jgi:hypothetical protein
VRHAAQQRRAQARVLADDRGRELLLDRGDQAAEGIAGHGRRGGGLAPADRAVRGLDPDHEIVGVRDRDAGHLDRLGQRQRDRDRIDPAHRQARRRLGRTRPLRRRQRNRHGKSSRPAHGDGSGARPT